VELPGEHFGHQRSGGPFEPHERARLQLLAGVHQRLAQTVGVRTRQQETLHGAATRHAMTEQTRRVDTRIVHDQEIAASQESSKARHTVVAYRRA
jgi:hypothetical protein